MNLRAAILFLALVVLATATFADANAWIEPLPEIRKLPIAVRVALLYVPYALLVGSLWLYAHVGSRVRGHIAWFVVMAVLAVAEIYTSFTTPVLMLVVALVLLQLTPRVGSVYDASSFPSIRAFLGLTLLLAISLKWGADIPGMDLVMDLLPRFPLDGLGLIVCAIAVGAFIAIAGLRHRRSQMPGAGLWLTVGIVTCIAGAVAAHLPGKFPYAFFLSAALLIVAHLCLFIGAFLLLSHLLPTRPEDQVAFNP
ncbi:MAG TPA: hypothetical protein VM051_12075 [Usitatibacter sp.]|nr:hypothetical protein [Usitatibacter sp.]